jgi:hypothetical protein
MRSEKVVIRVVLTCYWSDTLLFCCFQIALVRQLDASNMGNGGIVNCGFTTATSVGGPRCPHAERSLLFMAEYRFDNMLWLNDFQIVFKKMLTNGFDTSAGCTNVVCSLPTAV